MSIDAGKFVKDGVEVTTIAKAALQKPVLEFLEAHKTTAYTRKELATEFETTVQSIRSAIEGLKNKNASIIEKSLDISEKEGIEKFVIHVMWKA